MATIYFAWADSDELTFGPEHQVVDEDIVRFQIDGKEGECATLDIDVRNPRIGLLNAGRQLWAWLSYDSGTGGVIPLFLGRLVGIPTNILQEVVTLQFIAKPLDFITQKADLAETLKVRPYYDAVFIDSDKRDDPETVLEGYSALWAVDRTTLEVTISDIINGEDGTLVFTADEVPYDSVQSTIGQTPLTSIGVTGTVHWTQSATGVVDFGNRFFANGSSILGSWPKTGQQLSGGWSVSEGNAFDTLGLESLKAINLRYSFENRQKQHTNGDTMSLNVNWTKFPVNGDITYTNVETQTGLIPSEDSEAPATPLHVSYNMFLVCNQPVATTLKLQYDAKDNRQETVKFTLAADLQAIVTLPEPDEITEQLELNGTDVGLALNPDATEQDIPIVDTSRNGYFPSDRGLWSLEYLIAVARAHILARSRAVSVSWDCKFDRAVEFSCRKNATIFDDRLPGASATGKITSYSLTCAGDASSMLGNVTIQCAIGHDGTVSAVGGTPDYVADGYVETGYQTYSGQTNAPTTDVSYSIPVLEPGGLVYPLTLDQVLVSEAVTFEIISVNVGSERPFRPPRHDGIQIEDDTVQLFKNYQIPNYRLEVKPVTGNNFSAEYDVDLSTLKIPKQIDLGAPST